MAVSGVVISPENEMTPAAEIGGKVEVWFVIGKITEDRVGERPVGGVGFEAGAVKKDGHRGCGK